MALTMKVIEYCFIFVSCFEQTQMSNVMKHKRRLFRSWLWADKEGGLSSQKQNVYDSSKCIKKKKNQLFYFLSGLQHLFDQQILQVSHLSLGHINLLLFFVCCEFI